MGSGTGDDYASETCQEGCFTNDPGKLIPEYRQIRKPLIEAILAETSNSLPSSSMAAFTRSNWEPTRE